MLSLQLFLLNLLIGVSSASAATIPHSLGWRGDETLVCGGRFQPIQLDTRTHSLREGQWQLSTHGVTTWQQKNKVDFAGPVKLLSKDQSLFSHKARLIQDKKTGKLIKIYLDQGVDLVRPMQSMHAQKGWYEVGRHRLELERVAYRMDIHKKQNKLTHLWGQATSLDQEANQSKLVDVVYSACNPDNPTWYLKANDMVIDHASNQVFVYGGRLYLKSMPVFYVPYLNFMLKPTRRSGWLVPRVGYDASGGAVVTAPYYFNLAPNYDMTVDNMMYYHRGLAFNQLFRYLFSTMKGEVKMGAILHDKKFDKFRTGVLNAPEIASSTERSRKVLQDTNLFRWYMMALGKFNYRDITSQYHLGYVSDDYMLRDFSWISGFEDDHHIKNTWSMEYRKHNFSLGARILGYQTLQPIDEKLTNYPYSHLPALNVRYHTPWGQKPWQFKFQARSIYFINEVDRQSGLHFPSGFRYTAKPTLTMIQKFNEGYWLGETSLHLSHYHLKNALFEDKDRVVPSMLLELGWNHFQKEFNTSYSLAYRRSRYVDQSDIPLFDTSFRPVVSEYQGNLSRFIGEDRIADENDVMGSFHVQTITNQHQSWKAFFQQRYALDFHRVCLGGSCVEDLNAHQHLSPFITQLTHHYYAWNLLSNAEWDWKKSRIDRALISVGYRVHSNKRLEAFYLVDRHHLEKHDTDQSLTFSKKEALMGRVEWELNDKWSFSLTSKHDIKYQPTLGLGFQIKYHDCCTHLGLQLDQKPLALTPGISRKFHPSIKLFVRLDGLGYISR